MEFIVQGKLVPALALGPFIIFVFSDLFCKLWKLVLFWIADYTQKRESGFRLENATMFQIQNMFKNEKPDIVLKRD